MPHRDLILMIPVGVSLLIVVLLVAKFARRIATVVLILAAAAILIGGGVLAFASANGQAAQPGLTVTPPPTGWRGALSDAADVARALRPADQAEPAPPPQSASPWVWLCAGAMGTGALTVGGVAVYYWLRDRQAARSGRWRPGPNALWGRDRSQIGPHSGSTETGYLLPLLLQQLMGMQAMMMTWMQRDNPPIPRSYNGWWEDPLDSDENPTSDLSIWTWEDLWR